MIEAAHGSRPIFVVSGIVCAMSISKGQTFRVSEGVPTVLGAPVLRLVHVSYFVLLVFLVVLFHPRSG